jgi:hypothetical protein
MELMLIMKNWGLFLKRGKNFWEGYKCQKRRNI